ncbi:hypothetical protein CC78DRAFT_437658, partial [Lojkania enalia]
AVASTLALTTSRIIGFKAPSKVQLSSTVDVELITQGYIQKVADVGVGFGWGSKAPGYIGYFHTNAYLGPEKSNIASTNISFRVTVPKGLANYGFKEGDKLTLSAALYSIYGLSGLVTLTNMNVTVEIAKET